VNNSICRHSEAPNDLRTGVERFRAMLVFGVIIVATTLTPNVLKCVSGHAGGSAAGEGLPLLGFPDREMFTSN
jgi:hypothetical protein